LVVVDVHLFRCRRLTFVLLEWLLLDAKHHLDFSLDDLLKDRVAHDLVIVACDFVRVNDAWVFKMGEEPLVDGDLHEVRRIVISVVLTVLVTVKVDGLSSRTGLRANLVTLGFLLSS
jgi:hypothetical protein